MDPLSLLERKDKWFLGGGKGSIFAPPFPRWLETPGFWDESFFADIRLTRLFTVLFCDREGHFQRFRGEVVSWRPDRMILEHRSATHHVRETRCVTEDHRWVSVFELLSGEPLMAFVWSLPEMKEPGHGTPWQSLTSCEIHPASISYEFATAWPSELEADRTGVEQERITSPSSISRAQPENRETGSDEEVGEKQSKSPLLHFAGNKPGIPQTDAEMEEGSGVEVPGMLAPLTLKITLTANQERRSHTVNLAQRHDDSPLWETSLLPQKLKDGRLPGDFKLNVGPPPMEGLVHILQQYELGSEPLVVSCQVGSEGAVGPEVLEENEQAWRNYFKSVPQFFSSDPFLTNAYWYRWYGLRLNTVDIEWLPICGIGFQPMLSEAFQASAPESHEQDARDTHRLEADATFSPFITEGVGFFRNFVTYSAQAHLREVAWMHSPRLALGILENLRKCQRPDGSFPGHNYSCRPARDFYHADFATGAYQTLRLHPDSIRKLHLKALRRYAEYLVTERQIKEEGVVHEMYAIFDQNETGQEYMSRYQFVSEKADQWQRFVVAGCDATTYAAELVRFVCWQWPLRLGRDGKRRYWIDESTGVGFALHRHYDEESEFFCDVTLDGRKSPARPATGFYPLLAYHHEDYVGCLDRWLLNPNEFWLPKGFPATAASDPTFSPDGEWKGKRLNCPWSGRSWPMVNSHLVDALCNMAWLLAPTEEERERRRTADEQSDQSVGELLGTAFRNSEEEVAAYIQQRKQAREENVPKRDYSYLRIKAGEALMKTVTLMFHDGDPTRPNSYEHYDPITGTPSLYRGYDDYMHSWIVDLILRHAVGVKPGEDTVDPLPLGVDWIECTDIPHPKGRMSVKIEGDKIISTNVEKKGTPSE